MSFPEWITPEVRSQSRSVAIATDGGEAISSSTSYGNGRADSYATANAGFVLAQQVSDGRFGGFASGSTVAYTIDGRSQASGSSQAMFSGSVAQNQTLASSHFGSATANGQANAGPCGNAKVCSTALSDFGNANSSVQSVATHGAAVSEGVAHSFGPFSYTRTRSEVLDRRLNNPNKSPPNPALHSTISSAQSQVRQSIPKLGACRLRT